MIAAVRNDLGRRLFGATPCSRVGGVTADDKIAVLRLDFHSLAIGQPDGSRDVRWNPDCEVLAPSSDDAVRHARRLLRRDILAYPSRVDKRGTATLLAQASP